MNYIDSFFILVKKDSYLEHIEKIKNDFNQFISETRLEIITIENINTYRLINPYFEELPPFNKSIKKNEIPDAISSLTIEDWLIKNKQSAKVISGDGDFDNLLKTLSVKNLEYVEKIETVLDELLPNVQLKDFLSENIHILNDKIDEQFPSIIVSTDYYDAESQGQNLDEKTIHDISIIDVDEDIVYISVEVDLYFSVEFSYYDPDGYFWDSETKEAIYVGETQYKTVPGSQTVDIEFECEKVDEDGLEWEITPLDYSIYLESDEFISTY